MNSSRVGTLTSNTSAGVLNYLSNIKFSGMIGGVARYDRFSVMTDLTYLNASLASDTTHLFSVNPGPGPVDISRSQQVGTGTRSASTIWSLAAAHTSLQGDWGNVDLVGGMRILSQDSTTNYQLKANILAPNRTIALQRGGTLRVNNTYFDAGTGGIPLTWQTYGGIGYAASEAINLSAGYRYLDFENGGSGSNGVRRLSLGSAIFAANFRF